MVKCPDHIHTYRLTDLSIWNACALGMTGDEMQAVLIDYSKFPPPESLLGKLTDLSSRYGRIVLERDGDCLRLSVSDDATARALESDEDVGAMIGKKAGSLTFHVDLAERGRLKQALIHAGYPAQDRAGFLDGDFLDIRFRRIARSGKTFQLRDYQREAVDLFCRNGSNLGGSGFSNYRRSAGQAASWDDGDTGPGGWARGRCVRLDWPQTRRYSLAGS